MSLPLPMPCLADACPSPFRCADRGQCKAREADTWACWWQAFAACRERGITDPFGSQFDQPARKQGPQ